jgi:hypothetical protein
MTELIELSAWAKKTFKPKPPSLNTLYRMCRDREIPARKIGGTWYVHSDMTERYLAPPHSHEELSTAHRAYLSSSRPNPSEPEKPKGNKHLMNIILSRRGDHETKK